MGAVPLLHLLGALRAPLVWLEHHVNLLLSPKVCKFLGRQKGSPLSWNLLAPHSASPELDQGKICSSSPKANRLESQEEQMSQFKAKGRLPAEFLLTGVGVRGVALRRTIGFTRSPLTDR